MNRSTATLFPGALGVWSSTALTFVMFVFASAYSAQAGINVWTSHGPGPVSIHTFAIDPITPTTLYAGTEGAGVFDIEQVPPFCVGDCRATRTVAVNDIITLVNIALGSAQPSTCPSGLPIGGEVKITVIVQAVDNVLSGCDGG